MEGVRRFRDDCRGPPEPTGADGRRVTHTQPRIRTEVSGKQHLNAAEGLVETPQNGAGHIIDALRGQTRDDDNVLSGV